ncbi:hypothetical protein M0802_007086 [Mischocyttarus mexicanus]|nr:hypothetical protein M0802_007086 [Mischocyttarus mexicanus]
MKKKHLGDAASVRAQVAGQERVWTRDICRIITNTFNFFYEFVKVEKTSRSIIEVEIGIKAEVEVEVEAEAEAEAEVEVEIEVEAEAEDERVH